MTDLVGWAVKWGIPHAAIVDLRMRMGVEFPAPLPLPDNSDKKSESYQQSVVRLEAPTYGVWLTRNNVGCLVDANGRPVRYGLANESKQQNEVIKSGDLIGIRSVLITQEHVGHVIGQFVSRELKHQGWCYSGDKHEKAQLNWVNFVNSKGGDASFCTGPGSFTK